MNKLANYYWIELSRTFRTMYIGIILPIVFFLEIDKVIKPVEGYDYIKSNMVNMCIYGAVFIGFMAAFQACLDDANGWSRLTALTRIGNRGVLTVRLLVALTFTYIPITVVFILGIIRGKNFPIFGTIVSYIICGLGAVVFALLGLIVGNFFPSQAMYGIGSLVLTGLAFLSGLFIPLTGSMLKFARFNPMYSIVTLAKWPFLHGKFTDGTVENICYPLLGLVIWLGILIWVFLVTAKQRTVRR